MLSRDLLDLLSDNEWHTGASIAQAFGVSRAAVWKQIESARAFGLQVEADRGKGYRLADRIQLCDAKKITSALERASGIAVETHLSIDSTNTRAMDALQSAEFSAPFVVVADHQSAGKGRRGRQWLSPLGRNLYFTLVWNFERGLSAISGLSLVVAIALRSALADIGYQGIELKWPNDLVTNGKKLAGILIEVQGEASGPSALVIGVGVNVSLSEVDQELLQAIDQPWIDLLSINPAIDLTRNQILAALLNKVCAALSTFEEQGFKSFLAEWRQADAFAEQDVELTLGDKKIYGEYVGVAEDGSILINVEGEVCSYSGGEVSLRRANG